MPACFGATILAMTPNGDQVAIASTPHRGLVSGTDRPNPYGIPYGNTRWGSLHRFATKKTKALADDQELGRRPSGGGRRSFISSDRSAGQMAGAIGRGPFGTESAADLLPLAGGDWYHPVPPGRHHR